LISLAFNEILPRRLKRGFFKHRGLTPVSPCLCYTFSRTDHENMNTQTATAEEGVNPRAEACAHVAPGEAAAQAAPAGWTEVRNAKELGRAIARQRKVLGYGLVDAAALCQVGTRFLFELEHGKPTVEFDRALKVARRFGLRLKITGVD
jgi:hypothetical protein